MKKILLYGLASALALAVISSVLHIFNQAVEIDDLKSQIRLQKQALHFMQDVSNAGLSACAVSVATFEGLAKENGRSEVLWKNQTALVGPFRIKRDASCVIDMHLAGLSD